MDYSNFNEQQVSQTIKRFTKSEVYQAIQMDCYNKTGVMVSSVVKIEDCPNTLRHSCFLTGVTFLPQYIWQVPTDTGFVNVPYYFCSKCGKLFVYNHIYD